MGRMRAGSILGLAVAAPRQLAICIEGSSWGSLSMEVEETEPVRVLKDRLQELVSVRWEQYRLLLGGKEVADDGVLIDYNVADGATLQLEMRKPLWVQCLALVVGLLGFFAFLGMLFANLCL